MSDFEIVKAGLNVEDVISKHVALTRAGTSFKGLCPFHDEKTPSFMVNPAKQIFHCFGCGASGDVFEFLERHLNLDKQAALRHAAALANIDVQSKPHGNGGNGNGPNKAMSRARTILNEAAKHYHEHMLATPQAAAYLKDKRGHSDQTLKEMRIGWSSGRLHEHLRDQGYTLHEMLSSGLVVEHPEGLRDRFSAGVAMIPHMLGSQVIHFTQKDPEKKRKAQLPNDFRDKEWRFYHQSALAEGDIIFVEGEHDALSLIGVGIRNVAALIGQVSQEQLAAMAELKGKTLYLWLDRDKGGLGMIRRIATELQGGDYDIKIIEHPDLDGAFVKDVDEYVQALRASGMQDKEIRIEAAHLIEEALDYVSFEIGRAAGLGSLEEKLKALQELKLFEVIASMPPIDQEVYLDKLTQLGFSKEALKKQVEVNLDLKKAVTEYLSHHRTPDPLRVARIIFDYFKSGDRGRFFHDRANHTVYLLYSGEVYEIGSNRPFNALMERMTGLIQNHGVGRQVWESLANQGYSYGSPLDRVSWLRSDIAARRIYINLCGPDNQIVRLSPGRADTIVNGINEEAVFLRASSQIKPVHFDPGADIGEALKAIQTLIIDNLTCEGEQRYLIFSWMVSAFLFDFSPYTAIMNFSGGSASGKTTAASLISTLIYGDGNLGEITAAAAYSIAATSPFVFFDNLETDNRGKGIKQFLLLGATGGGKAKRSGGTDTGVTQEKPRANILVTAIEPFQEAELVNRTYDVQFAKRYRNDSFIQTEAEAELLRMRDKIISGLLKFIARDILPGLEERREYVTILRKAYKGHAKDRTDEYLALLMLILAKGIKHMTPVEKEDFLDRDQLIIRAWIEYQNRKAEVAASDANPLLTILDGMAKALLPHFRESRGSSLDGDEYDRNLGVDPLDRPCQSYYHPIWALTFYRTMPRIETRDGEQCRVAELTVMATTRELAVAMGRFSKDEGIRNPYDNAAKLAARLSNDEALLKSNGWTIIGRNDTPYFRVLSGTRYMLLQRELVK